MTLHKTSLFAAAGCLLATSYALAYVDLAPTLSRIVNDSDTIVLAEVGGFSPENGAVLLKKVRDLKGKSADDTFKHQVLRKDETAADRAILEWAEPGNRCVMFIKGKSAVVCVGEGWYQTTVGDNGWWRIGAPRPDLPLSFYGSVTRLAEALPVILAGKSAIITALPHGADKEGASFDLALNRSSMPGLVKVQRLRASRMMPPMAMAIGTNPAYVVGMGRVSVDELPGLRAKLKSADSAERAESAADIGFLGDAAVAVSDDLGALLGDKSSQVKLSAASALLRVAATKTAYKKDALAVLTAGMTDPDAAIRRHAARAAGLAGAAAAPLADHLGKLLGDPDTLVRRTALQAIATLGPAAATTREAVTGLLERPETAIDAADALGRMGPAAGPSQKALARLLSSEAPAERWAAIRAMSQIGGDGAHPAVEYMIKELPRASGLDGYNMLIYLSLIGPAAKDALPAIRTSRVVNPILKQATAWAIEPTSEIPAIGPFGEIDIAQYILESYVHELGDRLKPAAQKLAKRIMSGRSGNVPAWGYKLLARFPEESLAVFTPALADKELVMRERAAVALGYMGRPAAAARPQVAQALESSQDERERRLLQWCLRKLEP